MSRDFVGAAKVFRESKYALQDFANIPSPLVPYETFVHPQAATMNLTHAVISVWIEITAVIKMTSNTWFVYDVPRVNL